MPESKDYLQTDMKILIISDTHRYNDNFNKVLDIEDPIDMLIHCGDIEDCEDFYLGSVSCPVHMVAGNNDIFSELPSDDEFMIAGHKVFLTHGNHYYVSLENKILVEEALSRGADIVMYGHIHRPVLDIRSDITVINPGSLTYPRQEGRRPSYVVMEVDARGNIDYKVKFL